MTRAPSKRFDLNVTLTMEESNDMFKHLAPLVHSQLSDDLNYMLEKLRDIEANTPKAHLPYQSKDVIHNRVKGTALNFFGDLTFNLYVMINSGCNIGLFLSKS